MKAEAAIALDLIYRVPRPFGSLDEYVRCVHADLSAMSRSELLRERERVRLRLLLDDAPDPWLFRRLEALRRAVGNGR